MPAKIEIPNLDYWIERYASGESLGDLAKEFGISDRALAGRLRNAGIKLRSRTESLREKLVKDIPNLRELISRYEAGEGLQTLAREIGVHGGTLRRRFQSAGIALRSFLEQDILSHTKQLSEEVKAEIVRRYLAGETRHELSREFGLFPGTRKGRRGRPTGICRILMEAGVTIRRGNEWMTAAPPKRRIQQVQAAWRAGAERRERDLLNVAPSESVLVGALEILGIPVEQQRAVDIYNIDISMKEFPIAIEVEMGTEFAPSQRALSQTRLEYILDQGWALLWIVHGRRILTSENVRPITDKIVALLNMARGNEPIFGKYGVIYCNGKILTGRRYQFNTRPRIPGF